MTGTYVMNRRHNDMPHEYLGGTGFVKSKTSIGFTGSNRHGDVKSDKRQERSAKASDSNVIANNKLGGSNIGSGNGGVTASRKNGRQRQRPSDTKSGSKTKPKEDPNDVKASPVPPILPPISALQIINNNHPVKAGERSPRFLESSASNIPPLSLAPTRLALKNSASPDPHGATDNTLTDRQASLLVPEQPADGTNNTLTDRQASLLVPEQPADGTISKPTTQQSANEIHGLKLNSLPAHLSNGFVRPANSSVSPPPRSPRVISENSRLSPINSLDRPKVKFEKKVMKTMLDQSVPSSPRAYKIDSSETNPLPPQSREGKTPTQRRPSVKSLPKITPYDEHFSIRKKIEQFRKWHEEQHADNLKRLPVEDGSGNGANSGTVGRIDQLPSCSTDVMDFAKLLEEKIVENNIIEEDDINEIDDKRDGKDPNGSGKGGEKKTPNTVRGRKNRAKNRPVSGATWKTWRGVNESDAYDDVKKYIEDNDLMDTERKKWITSWLRDVSKAMSEMGEITIEV